MSKQLKIIVIIVSIFVGLSTSFIFTKVMPKSDSHNEIMSNLTKQQIESMLIEAGYIEENNLYTLDVMIGEEAYNQTVDANNNYYIRTQVMGVEKEEFIYDFQNDYFIYNYYIEDEVYITVEYDFFLSEIIEDEDEMYESLQSYITDFRDEFITLLNGIA